MDGYWGRVVDCAWEDTRESLLAVLALFAAGTVFLGLTIAWQAYGEDAMFGALGVRGAFFTGAAVSAILLLLSTFYRAAEHLDAEQTRELESLRAEAETLRTERTRDARLDLISEWRTHGAALLNRAVNGENVASAVSEFANHTQELVRSEASHLLPALQRSRSGMSTQERRDFATRYPRLRPPEHHDVFVLQHCLHAFDAMERQVRVEGISSDGESEFLRLKHRRTAATRRQ